MFISIIPQKLKVSSFHNKKALKYRLTFVDILYCNLISIIFSNIWLTIKSQYVIICETQFLISKRDVIFVDKKAQSNFWKTMWPFLRQHRRDLIFCVICAVFVGVFVAVQPFVIKYIVDDGIANAALNSHDKISFVAIACSVYILISFGRVLVWRLGYSKMFRSLEGALFNLRSEFFAHVQSMEMSFHENSSVGELYNCMMGTPILNIKTYMTQIFMNVPYQAVSLIISLIALTAYDGTLTAILLLTASVMALFNKMARKKMRRVNKEYIQTEAQVSKYLTDTLNGMDAIKLYSIENTTYEKFQDMIRDMYQKGINTSLFQQSESLKPELIQYIGTAVVYMVGSISCVYRGLSVGTLYAFLSCMTSILAILISWLNIGLIRASAQSGLDKITAVLDTDTSTPEKDAEHRRRIDVERINAMAGDRPCIEFSNVDFAYANRKIFSDFSCHINYGESVALVGASGSGKSTFTKLVMRLYDVQSGSVMVHGKNVRDFSLHDLRVSFGAVPQNPFIFYGSVWDNVKIARPNAENRDIINAMEIARVHEFVNNLENGWNTVIGDGGLDLSGGQRQRIAIARALLGNPDILIFDEATSALDNISEHAIQEAMEQLMKTHTVIIIAHRLSTIRNVDRILVFDNGKVIEEGTYDELKQKSDGSFAKLLKYSNDN